MQDPETSKNGAKIIVTKLGQDKEQTNFDDEEEKLVTRLKRLCNDEGKEMNPSASARIFHELGKLYINNESSDSDMFRFIKSAALFNAAIVRTRDTELSLRLKIEKDLESLCALVLRTANASNKDAKLVEQSVRVKQKVTKMRERVTEALAAIPKIEENESVYGMIGTQELGKINSIRELQTEIAKCYTQLMASVAEFCKNVMGDPPFKFSIVGMGSLARNEITPYSDFEHIIVLENDSSYGRALPYFKWFSVIFHIIIINLQETILASVMIPCLNDRTYKYGDWFYDRVTTCGISFDGMMPHACKFPLGRQKETRNKPFKTELIKTVKDMLKYLSCEENLKNGYHLSDILTKVCYVYGDQNVFKEFADGIKESLHSQGIDSRMELRQQVSEDLSRFSIASYIHKTTDMDLNIKKTLYRSTTLFISALGRFHNISDSSDSCFDIIESLTGNKYQKFKHALMFAVAVACEIRLRWYMQKASQCDIIACEKGVTTVMTTLLEIVGKPSVIKYFQIAYALQSECTIDFFLNRPTNSRFYSHPRLMNLHLYYFLDQKEWVEFYLEYYQNPRKRFDCYAGYQGQWYGLEECLNYFIEDAHNFKVQRKKLKENLAKTTPSQSLNKFLFLSRSLTSFSYKEALEWCQKSLDFCKQWAEDITSESIANRMIETPVGYIFSERGCKILNGEETGSGDIFKKFTAKKSFTHNLQANLMYTDVQLLMGVCLMKVNKPDEALNYFETVLQMVLLFRFHEDKAVASWYYSDEQLARRLLDIGKCLQYNKNLDKAITYLHKLKLMLENLPRPHYFTVDYCILETLIALGSSLIENGDHAGGQKYLKTSKNMLQHHNNFHSRNATLIFIKLAKSLMMEEKISEATSCLNELFQLRFGFLAIDFTFINLATDLREIAKLLNQEKMFKNAFKCLEISLNIFKDLTDDIDIDNDIANIQYEMGNCLFRRSKLDKARPHFQQFIQIRKNIARREGKSIADASLDIGRRFLNDNYVADANSFFQKCFETDYRSKQDVNENKAMCWKLLSDHLIKVKNYKDAVHFLEQLLQISESTADVIKKEELAALHYQIGLCYVNIDTSAKKAENHFRKSVEIQEQNAVNVKNDSFYAKTL